MLDWLLLPTDSRFVTVRAFATGASSIAALMFIWSLSFSGVLSQDYLFCLSVVLISSSVKPPCIEFDSSDIILWFFLAIFGFDF